MPQLTIGMATYNDFDGVYFTVQALKMYHDIEDVEIVVVDNSPFSSHSPMVRQLCGMAGAKYVPLQTPVGTSPSRNKVFEEASGEFVVCLDSHVFLIPEAVKRLKAFIPQAGGHIYSGPMWMDNLIGLCTHFIPQWRSEMFGIWGRTWQCPCGKENFTLTEHQGKVLCLQMPEGVTPRTQCMSCGQGLPDVGWSGHEAVFLQRGFKSLGSDPLDEPFEIPGQGLGMFGCRKDAWLQFVEGAIGFGGEELNVHELYRQKGFKAICLPFMGWLHKFGRPNGVPYPLQRYHKIRNSVLWHNRLGKPLDDIKEHFVATRLMSPTEWEFLIADPINHTEPPAACGSCNQPAMKVPTTIEEAYQGILQVERDFNQHMPKLRELADECDTIVDISIRQESYVALAASKAKTVFSYSNEHNKITDEIAKLRGQKRLPANPWVVEDIPDCDLLFLNTRHTGDQVLRELTMLGSKVKHYIVLHNTQIFGELGEGYTPEKPIPGILPALRKYMKENPNWSIVSHDDRQYGLTVMSCQPQDKKQLPGLARQAVNLAKAAAEFIADGLHTVTPEVFEQRLDVCAGCPQRNDERCGVCGCFVKEKAKMRVSECPLSYWNPVE